jgi:hypothetical protein
MAVAKLPKNTLDKTIATKRRMDDSPGCWSTVLPSIVRPVVESDPQFACAIGVGQAAKLGHWEAARRQKGRLLGLN